MTSSLKIGFSITCFFLFLSVIFTILYATVSDEFGAITIICWIMTILIYLMTISYKDYENRKKRKILPITV